MKLTWRLWIFGIAILIATSLIVSFDVTYGITFVALGLVLLSTSIKNEARKIIVAFTKFIEGNTMKRIKENINPKIVWVLGSRDWS